MTLERMQPVRDELIMFLTLDGCIGVFLVISFGVNMVQQRRTKSDIEELTRIIDDNRITISAYLSMKQMSEPEQYLIYKKV